MLVPPGEVRSIGRTIASDVAVEDNFMSGVHFEIENKGKFAELRDRNSTNKTWVNHVAQVKCEISPGDVIRAGKTQFSVQWQEVPELAPPPQPEEFLKETFESDEDSNRESSSPLGSSFAGYQMDNVEQPSVPEVADAGESDISVASRNSSPFESLDASYLAKFDNQLDELGFIPQTHEFSPGEFVSPFDDSSIVMSPLVAVPVSSSVSPGPEKPIPIRLTLDKGNAADAWSMIEMLSSQCDLRVVSHFRKIGQLTPNNLKMLPVFPFLADASEHLPVIVGASEWLRGADRNVTDRLMKADGLLLILSKATATIDLEVQELCNYRVAGFSEGNGFLGWCWPSQLKAILESLSDPAQSQFFGDSIESFVFSSSSSWIAYANPEMVPILAKFRFG